MTSKKITQAVILAGGLGTRLLPLTSDIPKPLIDINGKPFLVYLLKYLASQDIRDVVILTGYKREKIENYVGNGNQFGISVRYSVLDPDAQTSERIYNARNLLDKKFFLMYCDNYVPINLADISKAYYDSNKLAQIVVYKNKFSITKNNVQYKSNNLTIYDHERKNKDLNGVNLGFIIMDKSLIQMLKDIKQDFESIIFPQLIKNNQISCFPIDHKYYSIGSLDRLPKIKKYFSNNKFILLDRDGVLNNKMPKAKYVTNWSEWKWKEGSLESLKLLNEQGYKVIIVSNQPGISRGFMTEGDLEDIHKNMMKDVKNFGGEIESIYLCKCNWDDNCECRKPKPGMIFDAQHDYDFILSKTYFIGDDERDMQAAKNAGCKGHLLQGNDRLDKALLDLLF